MLPKSRRLTSQEVRVVLKTGRSRRGDLLSSKYVALPTPLRVSAVVSKATAKRAVERNRLRRALYRALMPIQGTGHMVIFIQKVPKTRLTPVFAEELKTLLKK